MTKTVLIIDDDENLRDIYRAALDSRGYVVVSASHGAEGVHLARRARPNLILLDLRMPIMSGRPRWSVCGPSEKRARSRSAACLHTLPANLSREGIRHSRSMPS